MKTNTLKTIPFDVHIPNLDGDGIAETIPIEVQAYLDAETGEEVLTPESIELIEKTQARHMGLISPEEIRELRERLDLTQEGLSDLLQIGAKTFTRWESGRARPSRSMNVLLCALRDGVVTVEYLRCLREGRNWEPLLKRRLEHSVVLFTSHHGSSKSQAVPSFRARLLAEIAGEWRECKGDTLQHADARNEPRKTRCDRQPMRVARSLQAWSESSEAA